MPVVGYYSRCCWLALSAFFFFLIYAFAGRDAGKLRMDWGKTKFFVPYGFVVAVTELTFIGAYLNTTMVNTIFLGALAPVFVAVLSFLFLKDRVDSRTLFSLAIGIVGVGFIVGADVFGMLNEKNLFGDVLALIYAMCYAVFIIYGRERAKKKRVWLIGTSICGRCGFDRLSHQYSRIEGGP